MARDRTKLHPLLQKKIEKLIKLCYKQGLIIGIGECVRTVEEQDKIYAIGRTTPGTKVTNAKGSTYSSMHQWGIAFDFYRNDGKGAYNTSDRFFERVGEIGKSIGLEWGGDWKNPVDRPHFQLPMYGSTTALIKRFYKIPDIYMACWGLSKPKKAITSKSDKYDIMYVQYRMNEKYGANLEVDGCLGPDTEAYNRILRKAFGWKVGDGKKITKAMLRKLK